jgi:endonuclease/exonuclease/phosphatase (EEP) superfamily protein YafD
VMRNKQLDQFATVVQKLKTDGIGEHMVIAWDFNVSPWSWYYQNLEKELALSFWNISRSSWMITTWRHLPLSFIQTHIDHIWLWKKLHFSHLQQINIKNSDHRWFYFVLHP